MYSIAGKLLLKDIQIFTSLKLPKIQSECVRLASRNYCSDNNLFKEASINPQFTQPVRYRGAAGFFNRNTGEHLWKSLTSVSNAGAKRGRAGRGKGKGKGAIRDLNRGQVIGIGKVNIRWPGLTSPIMRGRELVQREELPPDNSYFEKIYKIRDSTRKRRGSRIHPLDRGWAGTRLPGKVLAPPDAIQDYTFEGFRSVALSAESVFHMTKNYGRVRNIKVLCSVGNQNGLVGIASSKAATQASALNKARNRAGQRLMYIKRHEDSIYHDFFSRFNNTKVYVFKKGEGHGLICHRAIKVLCEQIGIKDIYAKVEGSTNVYSVTYAFLLGLLRQKTHQELADDVKLHLVERREENDFYPVVVASPAVCNEDIVEVPNYNLHIFDGKVWLERKKYPPFYAKHITYKMGVRKHEKKRSLYQQRMQLLAEYGEHRSFLTDMYKECTPPLPPWSRSVKKQKELEEMEGKEA